MTVMDDIKDEIFNQLWFDKWISQNFPTSTRKNGKYNDHWLLSAIRREAQYRGEFTADGIKRLLDDSSFISEVEQIMIKDKLSGEMDL